MGETTGGKICYFCGEDCAGQPRGKDPEGRYFHKRCLEAAKAEQEAAFAPALTNDGDDYGLLGDMIEAVDSEVPPVQGSAACPQCAKPMQPGAVVCMECGYNATTGVQLQSQTLKIKKDWSGTGSGVVGILLNPWILFLIVSAALAVLFFLLKSTEGGFLVYYGLILIFGVVMGITVVVFAFMQDGVIHGILCLICGIYALYYGLAKVDIPWVRALFAASIVGPLLLLLALDDLERMGFFDDQGGFRE